MGRFKFDFVLDELPDSTENATATTPVPPSIDGIYVGPDGDDLNLGTPESPVRTLSRAVNLLNHVSGIDKLRVYVQPGTLALNGSEAITIGTQDPCFDLQMFDSYGDGWDGAQLSIVSCDGMDLVRPSTLISSDFGLARVCFDTSQGFRIKVSDRDYVDVSWTFVDPATGQVKYQGTANTVLSEKCCSSTEWQVSVGCDHQLQTINQHF